MFFFRREPKAPSDNQQWASLIQCGRPYFEISVRWNGKKDPSLLHAFHCICNTCKKKNKTGVFSQTGANCSLFVCFFSYHLIKVTDYFCVSTSAASRSSPAPHAVSTRLQSGALVPDRSFQRKDLGHSLHRGVRHACKSKRSKQASEQPHCTRSPGRVWSAAHTLDLIFKISQRPQNSKSRSDISLHFKVLPYDFG